MMLFQRLVNGLQDRFHFERITESSAQAPGSGGRRRILLAHVDFHGLNLPIGKQLTQANWRFDFFKPPLLGIQQYVDRLISGLYIFERKFRTNVSSRRAAVLTFRKIGTLATLALLLVMAMLAGCGDDDGGSEEIYQPYDTTYINTVLPTRAFCDAQGYRQENDYSLRYYFLLDSCQLRLWADFIVDSKWERGYEPSVYIDGVDAYYMLLTHVIEYSPKIKDLYWVTDLAIRDSDSLRILPSEVFELDSMKTLWMERLHGLESFPVPVKAAGNLETLFIRDVSARNLPDEYWDVPWKEVFLSGIDLLAIPSGIEKLKTLKKLGVMGNAIERIPDFILNMNNLIAFDASVNSINTLPRGWCEWQIKSRDVRNNKLCNLPDSLWTCVDAMNQKSLQECE